MIKAFFRHNEIFLIMAVIFTIVFVCAGSLFDNRDVENLLGKGIEAEATIVPDSYYSNTTINNVKYYCVGYYFSDENGGIHHGKTTSSYTYYEIMDIIDKEVIVVKYDPKTFESVEAFYNRDLDDSRSVILVVKIIFGIATLLLWIISIRNGVNGILLLKVERDGVEYDAVVTQIHSNVRVNGVNKYKVLYEWTDEYGNYRTGASISKYTFRQACMLEEQKDIKIKALGKRSCIITGPQNVDIKNKESQREKSVIEQRYKDHISNNEVCSYCGHKLGSTDTYCPNCGANVIKK